MISSVVLSIQRMKTSVLLKCQELEPSPSWHMWPPQKELFAFRLGAKAEGFCAFQLSFLVCLKVDLIRDLSLKRFNLPKTEIYIKT